VCRVSCIEGEGAGQGDSKSSGDPSAQVQVQPQDRLDALGAVCDLLSAALADQLLVANDAHRDSVLKDPQTGARKRKAAWESALEVMQGTLPHYL
jgi:hypothetical protein